MLIGEITEPAVKRFIDTIELSIEDAKQKINQNLDEVKKVVNGAIQTATHLIHDKVDPLIIRIKELEQKVLANAGGDAAACIGNTFESLVALPEQVIGNVSTFVKKVLNKIENIRSNSLIDIAGIESRLLKDVINKIKKCPTITLLLCYVRVIDTNELFVKSMLSKISDTVDNVDRNINGIIDEITTYSQNQIEDPINKVIFELTAVINCLERALDGQ